jgi:hypothetical protein
VGKRLFAEAQQGVHMSHSHGRHCTIMASIIWASSLQWGSGHHQHHHFSMSPPFAPYCPAQNTRINSVGLKCWLQMLLAM